MSPCAFDTLFEKHVPHILENIFLSVDHEAFKACLEVNHAWNGLLKSDSFQTKAKSLFRDEILKDKEKLMQASEKGNAEEVKRLLSSGLFDANFTSLHGGSPLNLASKNGHLVVVQMLLAKGAEPKIATAWGWTSLHTASRKGHCHIVKILLAKGAEPNDVSICGWTPLHLASIYGHHNVVKALLVKGATTSIATKDGWTSLHLASQNGHHNVVKVLLTQGAKSNI